MRIKFDFGDLEAFLAVADLGSFQRAAAKLNASQPTLTRRIQKLEMSLGVTLFDRTTRSIKPTLAAKTLRSRAQAIVGDAVETILTIQDETSQFEHQRNAIVTVAAVPSAIQKILPNAIKRFRSEGHTARIRILDRLANDVAEAVAKGDADFGICSIPAREPNLIFEPVADDRLVLALRHDHPLGEKSEIRWDELEGTELIVPMKGTGNRMLIDEAFARSRQKLTWTYEVRRTSTGLGFVEAGLGIAALPETAIPDRDGGSVTSRPLVAPMVARTIGIVRRDTQALTSAAEDFCEILTEVSRAKGLIARTNA